MALLPVKSEFFFYFLYNYAPCLLWGSNDILAISAIKLRSPSRPVYSSANVLEYENRSEKANSYL
jgi:hypothetical protein